MVVSDWNALAGKVSQVAAVNFVTNKQDYALAATTKFPLFDEEGVEIVWLKGLPSYPTTLVGSRNAAHEFGVAYAGITCVVVDCPYRLDQTADGARGRMGMGMGLGMCMLGTIGASS